MPTDYRSAWPAGLAGLLQDCQTFANLRHSTTAALLSKAVATLNGYAQDFSALSAQQSW
ncbi:MAG: hypothetical protein JJD98_00630 [Polaromonas sp.]|nr:hypothetical protein [Polaromonas sp.]